MYAYASLADDVTLFDASVPSVIVNLSSLAVDELETPSVAPELFCAISIFKTWVMFSALSSLVERMSVNVRSLFEPAVVTNAEP